MWAATVRLEGGSERTQGCKRESRRYCYHNSFFLFSFSFVIDYRPLVTFVCYECLWWYFHWRIYVRVKMYRWLINSEIPPLLFSTLAKGTGFLPSVRKPSWPLPALIWLVFKRLDLSRVLQDTIVATHRPHFCEASATWPRPFTADLLPAASGIRSPGGKEIGY